MDGKDAGPVVVVNPGSFDPRNHFYPRVPNAQLHPLVRHFLSLGNERIAQRYCHLHPEVRPAAVRKALAYTPKWLRWAGADLFVTTTEEGIRRVMVVEVNSSPSGQKSMPLRDEDQEYAGYKVLLERTFLPMLQRRAVNREGVVAVLYDKNFMETSGYAATLADLLQQPVYLAHVARDAKDPCLRVVDGSLELRIPDGTWQPIQGAFRYVTQAPWTRIPPITKTPILNPVIGCLAGGRNKLLAAKAYDIYNARIHRSGLHLRSPETIWDVSIAEVPLWVRRMGGIAVVKDPYSNAGQGVFTIVNPGELDDFMKAEHRYDRFIVQALVGNVGWSSQSRTGRLYHVGTVPNKKSAFYAFDLRFMVSTSESGGFFPLAMYARRAREPLVAHLADSADSWCMLGTNLSVKLGDNEFTTEPDRLMLVDSRDFNHLGIGLDDLTEAYLQTVLAVTAIDNMASTLVTQKGTFRRKLFASLNPDPALAREIL